MQSLLCKASKAWYLVAKQIGSKVGGFRWGSCIVIITIIMIIIMNMDVKSRKSFKRFGDGIIARAAFGLTWGAAGAIHKGGGGKYSDDH